ncbi:MAG: RdgB/HAM1 family non-canonical purine NTP pyrophosphatase [Spirochaetaceae bacterium]|nr:RdgB/HAM1 family non-canonical purine NTP pyrophosphatase [Spirochaetaceae bacterium]
MDILFASTNFNKAKELKKLLPNHNILLPKEMGIEFDHEEIALTFYENALGKAKELFDIVKIPVLAEDSGLCIPALGGEPGIYSARYGSDGINKLEDKERNLYLLDKMKNISERKAFFVCSMVLFIDHYRFYICQETLEGEITYEPKGESGFGYDPVFFIPKLGKTAAELLPDEKNEISHRGKAGRAIAAIIEKYWSK